MKRLIIGPIPDQFNPVNDIILSSFSFVNQEVLLKQNRVVQFSVFSEKVSISKNEENLTHFLKSEVMPKLTRALNDYHHRNNSSDFWIELCLPWLNELAQMAWYYYELINLFITEHEGQVFHVDLLKPKTKWQFLNNTHLFTNAFNQKEFHFWLASVMVKKQAPKQWSFSKLEFEYLSDSKPSQSITQLKKRMMPMTGLSHFKSALFSTVLHLKPSDESAAHNHLETSQTVQSMIPKNFQDILYYLIDATLPKSIKEDLSLYEKNIREVNLLPGKYRVIPESFHDEITTLKAHCREHGEHIYQIPQLSNNIIDHNSRLFPHPHIRSIYNKHKHVSDELNIHIPSREIMTSSDQAIQSILKDFSAFQTCINQLSPALQTNIVLTKRTQQQLSLSCLPLLAGKFPQIKQQILPYQSAKDVTRSRLHILSSVSSVLSLVLASGAPFLLLLPNYQLRSGPVGNMLEMFKKRGLLFTDSLQCAKMVDQVFEDVENWYSQFSDLRNMWLNSVENFPKSHVLNMAKTLWKL